MNTNILFLAFLVIMIINTIIAIMTLRVQVDKKKIIVTDDPEIVRCKIASMQLFAGLGKLMELLEIKQKTKWTKETSDLVIKEMIHEKERIIGGKKANP